MPHPCQTSLEPLASRVLGLVATRRLRKPQDRLPRRLGALFRRLAAAGSPAAREEAQDLIWALWCDHADEACAALLHEGIARLAAEELEPALRAFERAVAADPDWAEAYNKRATVLFALGRDAESLADIAETLEREPRHFGAISGAGQILLRRGHLHEAAVALREALELNPGLRGLRPVLAGLDAERAPLLN
jgi:tetratricopeptide (TPR) repeat protein